MEKKTIDTHNSVKKSQKHYGKFKKSHNAWFYLFKISETGKKLFYDKKKSEQ